MCATSDINTSFNKSVTLPFQALCVNSNATAYVAATDVAHATYADATYARAYVARATHADPQTNVAGSEHTKSVSDGGLVADSEVAVANLFG